MWKRGPFCASCCLLVSISVGIGLCQDQEIDVRAKRYYTLLTNRPGSVQLFDRFYDAWLDAGTLEALEQYLNGQLASNPNVNNHLLLASFFERQGKHVESLRLYREAAERDPENGEVLYLKAQAELRTLDFDSAIFDLERARTLQLSGNLSEKCAKLLGKLYVRTTQTEKGRAVWQQLLQDNPHDEDLYEDLIELQLAEGLYEGAIATSDQLLAITKDSYETVMRRLRRGDILQYSGKNEEALEAYASCLSLVGHGTWLEDQIIAQIERVFHRDDNLSGLRVFYGQLIDSNAQRIGLKQGLARLLMQMGQHEEALALYQSILKVTPGDKRNQQAYVTALSKASAFDKAIVLLEQMRRQHPDDHGLLIQLADLYHQNRQGEKAGEVLQTFVAQSPETEYVFLRVGRTLEHYQLKNEAEKIYRQLIATWPESLSGKEAYAQFLLRVQKTDKAFAIWAEIARAGDVAMLVRAAQAVSRWDQRELALHWLESQYDTYSDDATFLAALVQTGLRLKHYDKTLAWARRQLEISERFTQIKTAVAQVVAVARRADRTSALIDELAAKDARSVQQVCLLAELYESASLSSKADDLLAQVGAEHRETALKQQIRLYRLRQDWSHAAEATQALLTRTGARDAHHVRDLVELYRKAYDHEKALEWIPAWKERTPGSAEVWITESHLLVRLGREADAITVLRRADQALEGRTEILSRLAELYADVQRHSDAQRIYWRLYEQAEDIVDKIGWMRDLGYAAQANGGRDGLIERLKERKRANPSSITVAMSLAEIYRQSGQYEERRQALMDATRIRSDDLGLMWTIAGIEEQEGDWERALETLARALPLDSTAKTRQTMARIHIQYGDEETGYRMLFDLGADKETRAEDVQRLANAMAAGQNWAMVVEFLTGILAHHPSDYKLHYLYAVALEEDGQDARALDAFLDLLDMTEEIPGNTAKPIPFLWGQGGRQVSDWMPPSALKLLEMRTFLQVAYQYRPSHRFSVFRRPAVTGQASAVNPPPSISDLPGFSMAHILGLCEFLNQSELSQAEAHLRSAGFDDIELLLDMRSADPLNDHQFLTQMAAKRPMNETLQAAWMLDRFEGSPRESESYRRVYGLFVEDCPRLAYLAGIHFAASGGTDPNIIDFTLETLKAVSEPGYYEAVGVPLLLWRTGVVTLPSDKRAALVETITAWYPLLSKKSHYRQDLFQTIAACLMEKEDLTEYVRFLDEEWPVRQGPSQAGIQFQPFRSASTRALIKPLPFPLEHLPGFSDDVLRMVNAFAAMGSPQVRERLLDYLEAARDPILRIVLTMAAYDEHEAKKRIDVLAAMPSPSPASLFLAASWSMEQEKPSETLIWLDKIRPLLASPGQRATLDGVMVAAALALDPKAPADARRLGQAAALRLRRNTLSAEHRSELIDAMKGLGLSQEAAQLATQSASVGPQRPIPTRPRRSRLQALSSDKIEELLDKGKQEVALRVILNDFRQIAQDSLYPSQTHNRSGGQGSAAMWIGLINDHGAMEAFMTLADPGDTLSIVKLNQFARICEILDEPERAKAVFERVLARRPRDVTARVHLALLLAAADPQAAAAQIRRLDQRSRDQLGPTLANRVLASYQQRNAAKALQLTELLAACLRSNQTPDRVSLAWVTTVLNTVSQPYHGQGLRVGSLYRVRSEDRHYDQKLDDRRRRVHNEICRSMLGIRQLSIEGFARLAAEAKARPASIDDLPTLAQEALLRARCYRGQAQFGTQGLSYSATDCPSKLIDPLAFLLRHSLTMGTLETFVPEFSAQLREHRRGDLAQRLEQMAALYRVPEEEFMGTAQTLLDGISSSKQPTDLPLSRYDALVWIVDAYADQSHRVDVATRLLDEMTTAFQATKTHSLSHWHVMRYLKRLAETQVSAGHRLLEGVVTLYVGPPDQRRAWVGEHYYQVRRNRTPSNTRILDCFQLLGKIAHEPGYLLPMMRYVDQMPALAREIHPGIEKAFGATLRQKDPTAVLTFLKASPFLGDVDHFTTFHLAGINHHSVFANLVRQLSALDKGQRHAFRSLFLEGLQAEAQTLGTRMFIAQLSAHPARAVHEVIAAKREAIESADAKLQRELAFMVADTLGTRYDDLGFDVGWSERARSTYTWLARLRREEDRPLVAELMNAQDIHSFRLEDHEFRRHLYKVVDLALLSDTQRARAVLMKGIELAEAAAAEGGRNFGLVRYPIGQQLMGQGLGHFALAADLLRDPNSPMGPLPDFAFIRYETSFYKLYRQYDDPNQLSQMQTFYHRLGRTFGGVDLSGITHCFRPIFKDMGDEERAAMTTWAEREVESGKFPTVAREIWVHARVQDARDTERDKSSRMRREILARIRAQDSKEVDFEERLRLIHEMLALGRGPDRRRYPSRRERVAPATTPIVTHYAEVVADETLSIHWRLRTLSNLIEWSRSLWTEEMLMQGMSLVTRGWRDRGTLSEGDVSTVLREAARLSDSAAWRHEVTEVTQAYQGYLNQKIPLGDNPTRTHANRMGMRRALIEMNTRCGRSDAIPLTTAEKTDLSSGLALGHASAQLMQGDPNAFIALMESAIPNKDDLFWDSKLLLYGFLREVTQHLWQVLEATGYDAQSLQAAQCARLSMRLFSMSSEVYTPLPRQNLWGFSVAMHVFAGLEDQLDEQWQQIPAEARLLRGDRGVGATLQSFARLLKGKDLTQKIDILKRYAALEFVQDAFRQPSLDLGLLYFLIEDGVLTEEEILKEGAELINLGIHPDRNWGRLAAIQAKHGRVDEANASWRRSIETCRIPDQLWRQTLAYARFLLEQGQSDMALLYVQKVDPRRLSEKYRDQWHEWVKKLAEGVPASKNSVTNP